MALSEAAAHYRAKYAALCRDRKLDDPERLAARRDLEVAMLEAHIAEVVEKAPPLAPEQQARISALLRTGGGH